MTLSNADTLKITSADGASFAVRLISPRAGRGPGLIVLGDGALERAEIDRVAEWHAGEGYTVMVPDLRSIDGGKRAGAVVAASRALRVDGRTRGGLGALGFGEGATLALGAAVADEVGCAVAYGPAGEKAFTTAIAAAHRPVVVHLAVEDASLTAAERNVLRASFAAARGSALYEYPACRAEFHCRDRAGHVPQAADVAFSRSLGLYRRVLGPNYDLSALWDNHLRCEFLDQDVDENMTTMIEEPYVNHIPTLTGGVGHDLLKRFYKYHFINQVPSDRKSIPISRTIGVNRIVDEKIFCFTHTSEIDWLLPGLKPTGKYVEVPTIAIVTFQGDKLCHEHIYWDQASVLVQLGLLDPKGLPVNGIECARKLVDNAIPSNRLMANWARSEGKPI